MLASIQKNQDRCPWKVRDCSTLLLLTRVHDIGFNSFVEAGCPLGLTFR